MDANFQAIITTHLSIGKVIIHLISVLVLVGTHKESSFGRCQVEVHRYFIQVWSWSLPNSSRQGGIHGTSQEEQGSNCLIALYFHVFQTCFILEK